MALEQADDFLAESETLHAVLQGLEDGRFDEATQFKAWTLNDVIVHLHYWNQMADLSLSDPEAFKIQIEDTFRQLAGGTMRVMENAAVQERGQALLATWIGFARDMGARWRDVDPKRRLAWAGPDMSARSSMTARQMETWAHGQEVFDHLGAKRQDKDRIRNIVILGINAFGWSHKVHGQAVPDQMPHLRLSAPSGAIWEFGDPSEGELITGPAVDFARVVTQTRNISDTDLQVTGPVGSNWMASAQCFAGPPETPPAPGVRHRRDG